MFIVWQVVTLIGIVAGNAIPDMRSWGLDFALIVTFIGMLVPLIKNRPALIAVVVAGATALLTYSLPNQLYIMVAALAGVIAGVIAQSLSPQAQEEPIIVEGSSQP
jgi:predicted branched-subunit amino acid permease